MPPEALVRAVRERSCVLFAGAGFSRNYGLPGWDDLPARLLERLPSDALGPSLRNAVLEEAASGEPATSLDLILAKVPRSLVAAALRDIVLASKPNDGLTEVVKQLRLCGVITTNYDRVFETLLPPRVYRLSNSLDHLKTVPTAVASEFLFKIHGDIDDIHDPSDANVARGGPFMVISQGDYSALVQGERLYALTTALHAILQTKSLLFVGFSYRDPDIQWLLAFLDKYCKFSNPSFFVCKRDEVPRTLPSMVTPLPELTDWGALPGWLAELRRDAPGSGSRVRAIGVPDPAPDPPDDLKAAFRALSQYLKELESGDDTERVVGSIVLGMMQEGGAVTFTKVVSAVQELAGVGPVLAEGMARAGIRLLDDMGLVATDGAEGLVSPTASATKVHSVARIELEREKAGFYGSIRRRLTVNKVGGDPTFFMSLDHVLQALCVDFGEDMAKWVHRGISRDVRWEEAKASVAHGLTVAEHRRVVPTLLDLVFSDPSDAEVPYLHRLLAASFLANSVRLDPVAARRLRQHVPSYELFLDSNVLLPALISDHPDHFVMKRILTDTREAGAQLFVLDVLLDEIRSHRKLATRVAAGANYQPTVLDQIVAYQGKRANCFVQGFVGYRGLHQSNADGLSWHEYLRQYTDGAIERALDALGVRVIETPDPTLVFPRFGAVLDNITRVWDSRGIPRASILNVNEAVQYCHIYARRKETGNDGSGEHVWFLSHELVLAKVFELDPASWGSPPTFPFSAWTAFLDARVTSGPRDARAIVRSILGSYSSAFDFPEPIDVVRRRAFGGRVPIPQEEQALQYATNNFNFIRAVQDARSAFLRRERRSTGALHFAQLEEIAVGTVSEELARRIVQLEAQAAATQSGTPAQPPLPPKTAKAKRLAEKFRGALGSRGG